MKPSSKIVTDNFDKLLNNLSKLKEKAVFVGVPSDTSENREDSGFINNATLAYINQNGSPAQNIPARPFMTIGMNNAKQPVINSLKRSAQNATSIKNMESIEIGLGLAGTIAESSIKAAINSNIQPALAPATIAARQRAGKTRTNTLVDTGALRNSIKYVIRENK